MVIGTAVVNIPPCVEPVCFTPPPAIPVTPTAPLLTITKIHEGNFTGGQQGTYTITVCNDVDAGPTVGSVIVLDTLPEIMTPVSMSGVGWVCDIGTVTCVRNDALNPGDCYPPITLIVQVAA